jgi:hypothetical protein
MVDHSHSIMVGEVRDLYAAEPSRQFTGSTPARQNPSVGIL